MAARGTFEDGPDTTASPAPQAHQEPAVWEEDVLAPPEMAPERGPDPVGPEPGADSEPPAGKGRRRGRGRGRGRRPRGDKPGEETAGAPGDEAAPESKPAAEPAAEPSGEAPPPRDWPRLMESAEHRTTGGDDKRPDITDEELSFSMRPPQESRRERHPGTRAHEEPPAEQGRADEPQTRETPEPFEPEREVEEAYEPRGFAEGPQHDLPHSDTDVPHFDDAEEVRSEETPGEALERAFEEPEEETSPRFAEEDEDFPPRRPAPRDDRRGERRNDRRGNGGGARRDDRRGGPRRGPVGRPGMGRPKPLIQDIFKRGQEVLVQVIKEGIGTKGPTLSTYISIAGRYLVLMPGLNRIGVSRKIIDEDARRRLREILNELEPPKGLGFIIRTAGMDRNKKELQRDLAYLSRLWQVVVRRIKKAKAPCEIYQESDMITRTIRDIFTSEIDTISVDEKNAFEHAKEFLQIVMPRYAEPHQASTMPPSRCSTRTASKTKSRASSSATSPCPAGGSIVIDQTEALVAIDVNSGNFRADSNAEETAYQMNLQAAKEIARQLRLRDLGGVIVNDFIDMRDEKPPPRRREGDARRRQARPRPHEDTAGSRSSASSR